MRITVLAAALMIGNICLGAPKPGNRQPTRTWVQKPYWSDDDVLFGDLDPYPWTDEQRKECRKRHCVEIPRGINIHDVETHIGYGREYEEKAYRNWSANITVIMYPYFLEKYNVQFIPEWPTTGGVAIN